MPRRRTSIKKKVKPLTEEELEQISAVFHQYETGVRSGRIRSVVNNTLFQESEIIFWNLGIFYQISCMPAWISWTKNALNIDNIFVHRWTRNQNTWSFFSKYFFQEIFHLSFSKNFLRYHHAQTSNSGEKCAAAIWRWTGADFCCFSSVWNWGEVWDY